MKVSIIIPTFRRPAILRETLAALADLKRPEKDFDVIVIDDGSEDETSAVVKSFQVKFRHLDYHYQKNRGAAAARNAGAKLAEGEILLFIDDDILLADDAIAGLIEFHQSNENCLLSGTWTYSPEVLKRLRETPFGRFKIRNDYTCMGGIEKRKLADKLYESESLASFCLSLPKETFFQIGGFDENFPYAGCEDQEFSMRALDSGIKLIYSTSIKTYHNELDRGDQDQWFRRQYTGVQGFPLLCELYPERKSSSLFRENFPITSDDNLSLKIKKIFKKVTYGPIGFRVLKTSTAVLEKTFVAEPILNRCYRLLGGMMIYQGFRVGQRNLRRLKNTPERILPAKSA